MFSKKIAVGFVAVLFFASAPFAYAAFDFKSLLAPAIQIGISAFTKNNGGAGGQPHPTCEAWVQKGKKPPQPPQCVVPTGTGGTVVGVCVETICKATQLPGGSSPDAGGQALQQILQQLMQKLMQGGQQQPPAGGGDTSGVTGGTTINGSQYPPCQINPASNTVTTVPCIDSTGALVTNSQWLGADGVVGAGDTSSSGTAGSIADLLTGSLQTGSGSSGSGSGNGGDDLLQALTGQTSGTQTSTTSAPATQVSANNAAQLAPGQKAGDIVVNQGGVSAVAGNRDQASNTEVSGFVGANTTGLQESKGATARLCESRPWASGFLSTIISPNFFDGVCAWRGYNVGAANIPVVTPVYLRPSSPAPARPVQQQSQTTPTVQPASVEIWATPPAVPLGTRTSIFWKAEGGAVSCEVQGPSFKQSGLSGGAATVPISGSSTFTVVCLNAAGGEAARDSVTITLSI